MEYTGKTAVGSPPVHRRIGDLELTKVAVGPLDNNCYILSDEAGFCVVIDAAADAETIRAALGSRTPTVFITTHAHADHWQALAELQAESAAISIASKLDASEIQAPITQTVQHGEVVHAGAIALEVIALRGHTPGSIALALTGPSGEVHLFTGDSLFPGGVGRTDSETFEQLFADVRDRIFDRFDDHTWVYPGHGWDTTLGQERPALPEWQARGW